MPEGNSLEFRQNKEGAEIMAEISPKAEKNAKKSGSKPNRSSAEGSSPRQMSQMMGKTTYLELVNSRIEKTRIASIALKLVTFLLFFFIMTHLNLYMLISALCLTLLFWAADATIKRHELIYRKLYNDIRFDTKNIDFDLYPVYEKNQVPGWWGAFAKSSVWIYYTLLMVLYITTMILLLTTH